MKPILWEVVHDLERVRAAADADAAALIGSEEARYAQTIDDAAGEMVSRAKGCFPVMLCGPSSAGKTTTAKRLCAAVERRGIPAFTVSLDDFYKDLERIPCQADGTRDLESPDAMDLELFYACVRELLKTRQTRLPRFDFRTKTSEKEARWLHAAGDAVVIFEGINAFSPRVLAAFDGTDVQPLRVFINTIGRFAEQGEVRLSRRDVRLCRRLLRDERTRATSFEATMDMWAQVTAGEERYIFPYAQTADCVIDTTMAYEPHVMAATLLPRLRGLSDGVHADKVRALCAILSDCSPLSPDALPSHSVMREFIGQ